MNLWNKTFFSINYRKLKHQQKHRKGSDGAKLIFRDLRYLESKNIV